MNINKCIFYTIFEIISLIAILFTTNILWNNFDMEEHAKTAYAYSHYNESIYLNIENKLTPLVPIKDDEINYNNKITIKVNNISNSEKKYNLYFKVNSSSNININFLKISLGKEKKYLTELENFKENNSTYYLIKTSKINLYNTYDFFIWLDYNTPDEEQGKTLDFEVIAKEL